MNPSSWFSILLVFGDVLLWDFDHSCSCAVVSHFYFNPLLLVRYFNFLTSLSFLLSFVPWISPQAFAHFYEKHAVVRLTGRQVGMRTLLLLFSPCPSPSPGACSNSCLLRWWCHPTISSCHPLLLLSSIFPSFSVFSNELTLWIRWPKYWSFSFSISPSNEYSGLISFGIAWFDLAVQGTLKILPQNHSTKALTLWHSAFFMVELSHSYMITGKTIALNIWTFVDKVMSLLINMLFRLVIAFLPRSKCLLISRLQSPIAVILEPKKIKSLTVSIVSPSICN